MLQSVEYKVKERGRKYIKITTLQKIAELSFIRPISMMNRRTVFSQLILSL